MEASKVTWSARVRESWPYATAVTTVLFATCSLVGCFVTWQAGADGLVNYVLAAADPALAAIGLMLVCVVAPDVFSGRRFRMPHVLTLPILYVFIVYAIKSLGRDSAAQLQRIEGAQRFDLIWLDHRVILEALVVLVVVMAVASVFFSEKEGVN